MLHPIALPTSDASFERLIPASTPARPRALAVLDGVLAGRAWADDVDRPSAALVIEDADGTVYAGGVVSRDAVRRALAGVETKSGDLIFGFGDADDPLRSAIPAEPYWQGQAIDFTIRVPLADEAAASAASLASVATTSLPVTRRFPAERHRSRYDPRMSTDRLHFTGDDEADRLLVSEPMALLIGFALDQQVPVQKAFSGPRVLLERLGTLDASELATVDEARLEAAAKGPPAIHRFPSAMARRVRELAAFVAKRYDGDASRLWTDAVDGADLQRRIGELPGFGEMKVKSLTAVLARRLGVRPPGINEVLPSHPTLGDVDSAEALAQYQATKRALKAAKREA